MGRRSGKTRRSPCSLAWLSNKITYKYVRKYEFNDRNYYCKNTCCINVDRKDSTDIIYKEVKRS